MNGITLTSDSAVYVWSLLQSTYIFGVLWASLFCSTEKQGRMENYQFSKLQHQHFEVCLCIENAMRSNKVDLCGSLLWGNVKALWLSLQDELSLQGLKRKLLGRADRHYYQELHAEVWFIKKACAQYKVKKGKVKYGAAAVLYSRVSNIEYCQHKTPPQRKFYGYFLLE